MEKGDDIAGDQVYNTATNDSSSKLNDSSSSEGDVIVVDGGNNNNNNVIDESILSHQPAVVVSDAHDAATNSNTDDATAGVESTIAAMNISSEISINDEKPQLNIKNDESIQIKQDAQIDASASTSSANTNAGVNPVQGDEAKEQIPKRERRFVGRSGNKSTTKENEVNQEGSTTTALTIVDGDVSKVSDATKSTAKRIRVRNQIPKEILEDGELIIAMKHLPQNYNLEVQKSIWRLREAECKVLALQFPEGLLMFACILSDIFERFVPTIQTVHIMSDVTYGACCVDDFGAKALGCDFMIHYGHSCLVPLDITVSNSSLKIMYIFVEIQIDIDHLIGSVKLTFPSDETKHIDGQVSDIGISKPKLALMGTVQFINALHTTKLSLSEESAGFPYEVIVPQEKPLSHGEVLGCTSPTLPDDVKIIVFVADGRFHLESAMIANPDVPAYRYDPYARVLTREMYDTPLMLETRKGAIEIGKRAKRWGIIFGTLGRQGNPEIVTRIQNIIEKKKDMKHFVILLSEISVEKLSYLESQVDAWIQIACPRLSIDWGTYFSKPLLSPYEAFCALGETEYRSTYPQDYYSKTKPEPWGNYYTN